MTLPAPALRPHCFGLPSVYHQESEQCLGSDIRRYCDEAAYAKLIALSAHVDVRDTVARYQDRDQVGLRAPKVNAKVKLTIAFERTAEFERVRHSLTVRDRVLADKLPQRVAEKMRLMMERGQDRVARLELSQGRNPFPFKGSKHFHVACEMLLTGGFTRSELRQELTKRLGWTQGTAAAHVSTVVGIFPLLQLAKEGADGRFTIHPALGRDTTV